MVKGWCVASYRFSDSFHSTSGGNQVVDLLAAVAAGTLRPYRLHLAALCNGSAEHLEVAVCGDVGDVHHVHPKAKVRLVAAILGETLGIGKTWERLVQPLGGQLLH